MKICRLFLSVCMLFISAKPYAQELVTNQTIQTTSHWKETNQIAFDLSEIAFVNWSAGGNNSISGLLKQFLERNLRLD